MTGKEQKKPSPARRFAQEVALGTAITGTIIGGGSQIPKVMTALDNYEHGRQTQPIEEPKDDAPSFRDALDSAVGYDGLLPEPIDNQRTLESTEITPEARAQALEELENSDRVNGVLVPKASMGNTIEKIIETTKNNLGEEARPHTQLNDGADIKAGQPAQKAPER